MIEAGKLRHRITIKSLNAVRNSYGESTQEWVDYLTARASKEPLLGNEYFKAEAIQSEVEVKFRMRYRAGVTNAMRVHHGTEIYEILSAINVKSLNRELLIYCKAAVVV